MNESPMTRRTVKLSSLRPAARIVAGSGEMLMLGHDSSDLITLVGPLDVGSENHEGSPGAATAEMNAPILGSIGSDGYVLASGHQRGENGSEATYRTLVEHRQSDAEGPALRSPSRAFTDEQTTGPAEIVHVSNLAIVAGLHKAGQ